VTLDHCPLAFSKYLYPLLDSSLFLIRPRFLPNVTLLLRLDWALLLPPGFWFHLVDLQ
jgi:hypothetical protein